MTRNSLALSVLVLALGFGGCSRAEPAADSVGSAPATPSATAAAEEPSEEPEEPEAAEEEADAEEAPAARLRRGLDENGEATELLDAPSNDPGRSDGTAGPTDGPSAFDIEE